MAEPYSVMLALKWSHDHDFMYYVCVFGDENVTAGITQRVT